MASVCLIIGAIRLDIEIKYKTRYLADIRVSR